MTVFNLNNTEYKEGNYSLFLGQAPALYDSINVTHPELFKLYKQQKAQDWSEDELDLGQSKIDMLTCPPEVKDIMIKNLALQWELDSVACRSIAPLLAPFITNSEYWAAILKVSEIEVLHALTYSEIVRNCITDPQEIFDEIMKNENMTRRASPVGEVFNELRIAGAKYTLGMITDEQAYPIVMNAVTALYCLERLQFPSSFAPTFAIVEQGWFQAIGKYVQKIMIDERFIHAEIGKKVLEIELSTERGKQWRKDHSIKIVSIVEGVENAEREWNTYLFSEGRKVVGLNERMGNLNIDYNAQDVYDVLSIPLPFKRQTKNPLPYMDEWLDINATQNAQQEGDSANYLLNIIVDDLGDKVLKYDFT
jgi:ribonucleoside-diphosphate reductase beta chain